MTAVPGVLRYMKNAILDNVQIKSNLVTWAVNEKRNEDPTPVVFKSPVTFATDVEVGNQQWGIAPPVSDGLSPLTSIQVNAPVTAFGDGSLHFGDDLTIQGLPVILPLVMDDVSFTGKRLHHLIGLICDASVEWSVDTQLAILSPVVVITEDLHIHTVDDHTNASSNVALSPVVDMSGVRLTNHVRWEDLTIICDNQSTSWTIESAWLERAAVEYWHRHKTSGNIWTIEYGAQVILTPQPPHESVIDGDEDVDMDLSLLTEVQHLFQTHKEACFTERTVLDTSGRVTLFMDGCITMDADGILVMAHIALDVSNIIHTVKIGDVYQFDKLFLIDGDIQRCLYPKHHDVCMTRYMTIPYDDRDDALFITIGIEYCITTKGGMCVTIQEVPFLPLTTAESMPSHSIISDTCVLTWCTL